MKAIRRTVLYLFILQFFCIPAFAVEKITHFDSKVTVETSGRLIVKETISVIAEGKQIRRGIYRDFPTKYTTESGRTMKVGFELVNVTRNGKAEPHHTKSQNNGIRIYIGDKNHFLKAGPHTYTITYHTDRQIGFFLDYDELYWNVTGNGWAFPIELATTTILLPPASEILQYRAYTGRQGSSNSNAHATEQYGNRISFETTSGLGPKEGLTVAVSWPKGIVKEPSTADKAFHFLGDNNQAMVGLSGLLLLLLYYVIAWAGVGKDPDAGAIIPRFEPPEGFTPAASRFVMKMGFDNKAFTSAIVNMAVKNQLKIEDKNGSFVIKKGGSKEQIPLSSGEAKIMAKLFSKSERLELKRSHHKQIRGAISAMKQSIQTDFEKMHFKNNFIYLVPGGFITLLILLAMIITADEIITAGFLTLWLSLWSVGCYGLFLRTYNSWKIAFSTGSGIWSKVSAFFSTLFMLPFLGGLLAGMVTMGMATSVAAVISLFFTLFTNILFYHLLKAPTLQGRKIMDQLEGLKLYMTVAEKDRLNLLNPPEKTPKLYEKLLPWALALGVEQEWGEQFNELFEKASREDNYSPSWYHSSRPFSSSALASSLGPSLSSTISSSSRAPGSSSGSSGGGSSGGGGGGGGGGGW